STGRCRGRGGRSTPRPRRRCPSSSRRGHRRGSSPSVPSSSPRTPCRLRRDRSVLALPCASSCSSALCNTDIYPDRSTPIPLCAVRIPLQWVRRREPALTETAPSAAWSRERRERLHELGPNVRREVVDVLLPELTGELDGAAELLEHVHA